MLMNVTTQSRDKALKAAKDVLDRRVYTGKTTKLSAEERERQIR